MLMAPDELFAPYLGHDAAIVAFVRAMRRHSLTPDDVLSLHGQFMAEMLATMRPPPEAPAAPDPDTRRAEGQADTEFRLGPCPLCGGDVWGVKKCPYISPPWRTFLACDNDGCTFHGRSRLTVEELRRRWPDGVEED